MRNLKLQKYLQNLSSKIIPDDKTIKKIFAIKEVLLKTKKNRSKVLIFGNGGSAAIASHVSVDLTKNTKIRAVNFK